MHCSSAFPVQHVYMRVHNLTDQYCIYNTHKNTLYIPIPLPISIYRDIYIHYTVGISEFHAHSYGREARFIYFHSPTVIFSLRKRQPKEEEEEKSRTVRQRVHHRKDVG